MEREPKILLIESTSIGCSLALSEGDTYIFNKEFEDAKAQHSALLAPAIDKALRNTHYSSVDAVAISNGPGSYTGLRIAASLAKGLCMGWNIPLIAIPTLDIIATTFVRSNADIDGDICVMTDAKRMEVYTAMYDSRAVRKDEDKAVVVDKEYLSSLPKGTYIVGDGTTKLLPMIKELSLELKQSVIKPTAKDMAPLAFEHYKKGQFVDVAYHEPNYLKEYVAIISKNKVLGR